MTKGKGIRAAKAIETRSALIRTARRLFAEKGFYEAGTAEIVSEAGVSRGALQHYFPRKEDLFLAVFEEVEQDMLKATPKPSGLNTGEQWLRLKSNVSGFLDAAATPEVQRIILIDGPAVLGWTEWRRLEAQYGLGVIEQAIIDGMEAGYIRRQQSGPLAHLILSIIDEAALLVANAVNPDDARSNVKLALQTLLSSLE